MPRSSRSEVIEPVTDVHGWVEQESTIMFKAATAYGDPVELSAHQARTIAQALVLLATKLEQRE